MATPKITGEQALLLFFLLFVTSPITALVSAKIADALWNQLLASQYGSGPSYQSWYGISLLVAYLQYGLSDAKPDEGKSLVRWGIERTIAHWFFGGILLLAASLTCFVLGWR